MIEILGGNLSRMCDFEAVLLHDASAGFFSAIEYGRNNRNTDDEL